jgi:hypothetical protein
MLCPVRVIRSLVLISGLAWGCGQKQAQDPRSVLGEHMSHGGVDGRTGQPVKQQTGGPRESTDPASPEECQAAARHLVELGVDLAILEEKDPQKKQRLQAERARALESEQARAMTRKWTQECLDRADTEADVACILAARKEADLERCGAGP